MQSDITLLNRQWIALLQGGDSSIISRDCRFITDMSLEKKGDAYSCGFALFMPTSFKVMEEEEFYGWSSLYHLEHTYLLILKRAAEASIPNASLRFGVERSDLRELLNNPYLVPVTPWNLRYPASVFEQASSAFESLKVKMAIFKNAGMMECVL